MSISRRNFALGLSALALSACNSTLQTTSRARPPTPTALPADLQPQLNRDYAAWMASFRGRALSQGITESTLNAAFRDTGYLPGVIKRDRNQTEFTRTLEDYLSIAASDERVTKGRAAFSRHQSTLQKLEQSYGVDAEIICAIWGLESYYGDRKGDIPVISATSTLAFDGRRGSFYEKQLIAALKILQNGDITPARMTGSWAGAMGHTQFIPTSYQAFAVDYTGDGRRDIWSDDPSDSLASTAAYLQRNGWSRGTKWGRELRAGESASRVIQPQTGGPRFAVTGNFNAIKRYNNSDSYAIGVGHLADRIGGAGPLRTAFPPDKFGLTKDDRIALQSRLTARGFDTGGADGVLGPKSRAAIADYQRSLGLDPTGDPSQSLLKSLA
ncbi:Membrane-bound lytic murein transglycosylase B precursor [Shimia sp. SK013]|uniref:lytic murein transglycosylase n=1 Tax=Shimia sp. SK013 TaxID=1389006 RepID=UPI0006B56759|nr:lytic murein transglycosylase [Shimia sp. SK013]KPA22356.1 Membrane-bound lytic murein transglycosylase B precursor [Shimia sp. SK013]